VAEPTVGAAPAIRPTEARPPAAESAVVRLAYAGGYPTPGLLVAADKGYFAEVGIEVEMQQMSPTANITTAIGDLVPGYQSTHMFFSQPFAASRGAADRFMLAYLRGTREYAVVDSSFADRAVQWLGRYQP
jgi:NMT1/THI5 like